MANKKGYDNDGRAVEMRAQMETENMSGVRMDVFVDENGLPAATHITPLGKEGLQPDDGIVALIYAVGGLVSKMNLPKHIVEDAFKFMDEGVEMVADLTRSKGN